MSYKQSQVLELNEPKKHSVRYDAPKGTKDPLLQSVYLSNVVFNGARSIPRTVTVTIEWEE